MVDQRAKERHPSRAPPHQVDLGSVAPPQGLTDPDYGAHRVLPGKRGSAREE